MDTAETSAIVAASVAVGGILSKVVDKLWGMKVSSRRDTLTELYAIVDTLRKDNAAEKLEYTQNMEVLRKECDECKRREASAMQRMARLEERQEAQSDYLHYLEEQMAVLQPGFRPRRSGDSAKHAPLPPAGEKP